MSEDFLKQVSFCSAELPIPILPEQMAQSLNSNCETERQWHGIPDSDRVEPAFCP